MKSISLFVDNGTYLTKVHPFTKLMYIAAAISIPLISGRLWMFGVFIAVSLLVLASGKILKKTLPLIAFSFTILLTIFLIHGLFNQKNVNVPPDFFMLFLLNQENVHPFMNLTTIYDKDNIILTQSQ